MRFRNYIQLPRWAAFAGLFSSLVIGGLAGWMAATIPHSPISKSDLRVPVFIAAQDRGALVGGPVPSGFAPVLATAQLAVVNVSSARIVRSPGGPEAPLFNHPFFRDFFDQGDVPPERREQSLGSGVIVSPEGYILTNNHVVQGATTIDVALSDNRQFRGRIIGTDPKTDIAVLKVEATNLPVLTLGDSSKVQVGDFALAIGNPFGIGQTVTMGIVSATGRGNIGIADYEDFIQTDASINPGNSGGALTNVQGHLVGINTAILSRGAEGNQGIGFAVPVNMARQVFEQILQTGKVTRGYMGLSIQPVTPAIARALGLEEARGALVGDVVPNSPASAAGIRKGDVIIAVNGEPVAESRHLRLRISQTPPGSTVRLRLLRGGNLSETNITLQEMPGEAAAAARPDRRPERPSALDGLEFDNLTPQIARQLDLPPQTRGVVITDVAPGSVGAQVGLRRGDVIQEVDRRPVTNIAEFERAVTGTVGKPLLLLVNRRGTTQFVAIEPR